MKAWMDGIIVDAEQARVPVLDHGYLYGDGVFEGIRIAKRHIFRLADHVARLQLSAKAIGLSLPWTAEEISAIVIETASAFDHDEAYVRLLISRGTGALGVDPSSCSKPRLVCLVGVIALYGDEERQKGLSLVTSSLRRPAFDTLDPRVKSLNYLNNVMAKAEAKRHGADEALILNQTGRITETSVANIFAVRGGRLTTPPTSEGALAGITRQSVMEIALDEAIPVEAKPLTRIDLLDANEVFLTGSGAGIIGVRSLDGQPVGSEQRRPVTTLLAERMHQVRETRGTAF